MKTNKIMTTAAFAAFCLTLIAGTPAGRADDTVGVSTTTAGRAACWVSYDSYRDRYRIPLGDAYARYTSGGRSPSPDAYYDSADCGDGAQAGTVDHGEDIEFFLTSSYHIDEVTNDGGKTYCRLTLDKYCATGCSGTCVNSTNKTDTAVCTSTSAGQTWREAIDIEGDSDACHRPDIVLTSTSDWYPGLVGTIGYEYKVQVWVCDSNGTNCTYSSDTGCVDIEFE